MSQTIQTHIKTELFGPEADQEAPATVFLEIPHGATTAAHLEAIKTLGAEAPEDWDTVYWCTTDQGAPEVASAAAKLLVDPSWAMEALGERAAEDAAKRGVCVVRGLIPRHFIDLNRLWIDEQEAKQANLTPIVPPFLKSQPKVGGQLRALYREYHSVINAQYERTCQAGGQTMQVHTYSPRSVSAPNGVSGQVLREAWSDAKRESWPLRPAGQLITGRADEPALSDARLSALMVEEFAKADFELSINDPFSFHPVTTLDALGHRWPGQVMAIELGRERLAERYDPLGPWTPSPTVVAACAHAMAKAIAKHALG